MRKYYILFSCDAWKSYASFHLVGVFTFKELLTIIKRKANEGDFEFCNDMKEINSMTIRDINTALTYGYVQEIQINECLA